MPNLNFAKVLLQERTYESSCVNRFETNGTYRYAGAGSQERNRCTFEN